MSKQRCEGWRRNGGAFAFGPVKWCQCKEEAIVLITFEQGKEKKTTLPACKVCWEDCISAKNIKILDVRPITNETNT